MGSVLKRLVYLIVIFVQGGAGTLSDHELEATPTTNIKLKILSIFIFLNFNRIYIKYYNLIKNICVFYPAHIGRHKFPTTPGDLRFKDGWKNQSHRAIPLEASNYPGKTL